MSGDTNLKGLLRKRRSVLAALSSVIGLISAGLFITHTGILNNASPVMAQSADAPSGTMTLYTSDPDSIMNQVVNDFNEVYPDITVNIFRSGGTEVVSKLQAEQSAGGIQADAIMVADGAYINQLISEGLLLSYRPPNADQAPDRYHYGNDEAHDVRLTFVVIAYNTLQVETPPTGYQDLLDPEYKDRIASTNPLFNGTAFSQMGTFVNRPEFGWEFFEALRDNGLKFEQGNTGLGAKVANGDYALASTVDIVVRSLIREGSPVAYVWPEEGALQIQTPYAILKDSPNVELAKTFLDYLYSDRAQQLYLDLGFLSVRDDMPKPDDAAGDINVIQVDSDYIEGNREALREGFTDRFGGA